MRTPTDSLPFGWQTMTGRVLDYWVARGMGYDAWIEDAAESRNGCDNTWATLPGKTGTVLFEPSEEWDDGGRIIESERIPLQPWTRGAEDGWYAEGEVDAKPLVAAMRAFVFRKFGLAIAQAHHQAPDPT